MATFYHYFSLVPKGQHVISVCLGTACYVKGSGKIFSKVQELLDLKELGTTKDRLFSLDCTRCVGACAMAPVMIVDSKVYGNVQPDGVERILGAYGFQEAPTEPE